jgi:hypothetical protein
MAFVAEAMCSSLSDVACTQNTPGFAEVLPVERAGAKNDSRKWPGSGPPNYRAGTWSDPSDSRPVACSTGILLNGLPKDLAVELTQRPGAFLSGPHNHVGRNK